MYWAIYTDKQQNLAWDDIVIACLVSSPVSKDCSFLLRQELIFLMACKQISLLAVYTVIWQMLWQLHIIFLQSCYSWSRIVFITAVPATNLNPLMCCNEWSRSGASGKRWKQCPCVPIALHLLLVAGVNGTGKEVEWKHTSKGSWET